MRGYNIISQLVVDSLKTEKSIIVKTEKNVIELFFFFFKCSMLPLDLGNRVVSCGSRVFFFFFLLWLHPSP